MTDKELYESLTYENKNAYLEMSDAEKDEMYSLCDDYRAFLDTARQSANVSERRLKWRAQQGIRICLKRTV